MRRRTSLSSSSSSIPVERHDDSASPLTVDDSSPPPRQQQQQSGNIMFNLLPLNNGQQTEMRRRCCGHQEFKPSSPSNLVTMSDFHAKCRRRSSLLTNTTTRRIEFFSLNNTVRAAVLLQLYYLLFVALLAAFAFGPVAADFIDKVECEKDKMVVYINEAKVQEDYPAIGVDRYSVYVHQFKDTCNDQGIVSQSNSLKSKRFVVPLNAGCGINSQADNTMGIHKEWLVYQATVRLEAIKPRSPDGRILEQRVKCVYSTSHQATASSNRLLVKTGADTNMVTSRQSPILGAGTVEGSAPPIENFIELFFASPDPKFSTLPEATIGDAVRIVLRMSHNVAYSAMKPEFCIISNKPYANRNDPDFRELIIVNGGCSVQSTPPLIPKMVYRASVTPGEPEMYYSKFTMFKMGDYNELHAMCNVKLCISSSEKACDTTQPRGCFESVRRRRKKRSPDRWTIEQSSSSSFTSSPAQILTTSSAATPTAAAATTSHIPQLLLTKQLLLQKQHPLVRLASKQQPRTQQQYSALPVTAAPTAAASGSSKPFNPDLLTVSGRLHVNQQNVAASAALAGSQLCFHSVTFSIMAAILAWLFVMSFCCVVSLACLLRRQKQKLRKYCCAKSQQQQPAYSNNNSPLSSNSSSRASPASNNHEVACDNNSTTSAKHTRLEHYQAAAATYDHRPSMTASANLQQHTLMYSIPHASRMYCSGGGPLLRDDRDADNNNNSTTMLKLRRHFTQHQPAHATLLSRRQSTGIMSPFAATTITAHNRHQRQLHRHHTIKPSSSSSSSSSSASSTSSALPASPSPFPPTATDAMFYSNDNNKNMQSHCSATIDSTYDVLG